MHKIHCKANKGKYTKKMRSQRRIQRLDPKSFVDAPNIKGSENFWFQRRKKMSQRIEQISKGRLILLSNSYQFDNVRYWVRDSHCHHVFKISFAEIITHGYERVCPYCAKPIDMLCFGSIQAIQEHVWNLSFNNLEFAQKNTLGSIHSPYIFYSHLHENHFIMSYECFIELSRKGIHINKNGKMKNAI